MALDDYFKPLRTMTPDEVRSFLETHRAEDYTLLDVRRTKEYERAHLPGAVLLPLDELPDRMGELDPGKPTIVY